MAWKPSQNMSNKKKKHELHGLAQDQIIVVREGGGRLSSPDWSVS